MSHCTNDFHTRHMEQTSATTVVIMVWLWFGLRAEMTVVGGEHCGQSKKRPAVNSCRKQEPNTPAPLAGDATPVPWRFCSSCNRDTLPPPLSLKFYKDFFIGRFFVFFLEINNENNHRNNPGLDIFDIRGEWLFTLLWFAFFSHLCVCINGVEGLNREFKIMSVCYVCLGINTYHPV